MSDSENAPDKQGDLSESHPETDPSNLEDDAEESFHRALQRLEAAGMKSPTNAFDRVSLADASASGESGTNRINASISSQKSQECRITELAEKLADGGQVPGTSSPDVDQSADQINKALGSGGALLGSIGGILTVGAGSMSAVAGPIGLIGVGAGLTVISSLLPGSDGPPALQEADVQRIANELIHENNDKILDLVQEEVNQVAACLQANLDQAIRSQAEDDLVGDVKSEYLKTAHAFGRLKNVYGDDFHGYESRAMAIEVLCNPDIFTAREAAQGKVGVRTLSPHSMAELIPIAKRWYDVCRANAWGLVAVHYKIAMLSAGGKDVGYWNKDKIGTTFTMSADIMTSFSDFFVVAAANVHRKNNPALSQYAEWARSTQRLFAYLLEHHKRGISYPSWKEVEAGAGKFYCRTCESNFEMLGWRSRRHTNSPWTYHPFPCANVVECHGGATPDFGTVVEGGANGPAYWKGDSWGFDQYTCVAQGLNDNVGMSVHRCDYLKGVSYPNGLPRGEKGSVPNKVHYGRRRTNPGFHAWLFR